MVALEKDKLWLNNYSLCTNKHQPDQRIEYAFAPLYRIFSFDSLFYFAAC